MTFSHPVTGDQTLSRHELVTRVDGVAGHADSREGLVRLALSRRALGILKAAAAPLAMVAADAGGLLAAWSLLVPAGAADLVAARFMALTGSAILALSWAAGLYPGYRLHAHERLRRRTVATLAVGAVSGLVSATSVSLALALLVAAHLSLAFIMQPAARGAARGLLRRAGLWGETARVIGDPSAEVMVAAYFNEHWRLGIRVTMDAQEIPQLALVAGLLPSAATLEQLRLEYAEVLLLADVPGQQISGLRTTDLRGEIGLPLGGLKPRQGNEILSRVSDLLIAVPALVLVSPLLAAAAAAIVMIDPGPVIFRQVREGWHGSRFEVLKLRTMYQDAEKRLQELLSENPTVRAEWELHYKLRRDPRLLPVIGRVLRVTSIDELPQLFNVIAGEMRLVGPRPFPLYHVAAMAPELRAKRNALVPGITGLWQVSGRSDTDLGRQQWIDAFYVENHSFWLDLHILLTTPIAVLRGRGAR